MKKYLIIGALALSFLLDGFVAIIVEMLQFSLFIGVMEWFSHLMTVFFILIIVAGIFLYQERKTRYVYVLFISFALAIFLTFVFKMLFMRMRPLGIQFLNMSLGLLSIQFPDFSFPSVHAAAAFSVLPTLDTEFRKIKYFWILFSIAVAISRIYLKMHFLSDIVAGATIGYFVGKHSLKFEKEHGFGKILQPGK